MDLFATQRLKFKEDTSASHGLIFFNFFFLTGECGTRQIVLYTLIKTIILAESKANSVDFSRYCLFGHLHGCLARSPAYGCMPPEEPAAAYILFNKAETTTDCTTLNIGLLLKRLERTVPIVIYSDMHACSVKTINEEGHHYTCYMLLWY